MKQGRVQNAITWSTSSQIFLIEMLYFAFFFFFFTKEAESISKTVLEHRGAELEGSVCLDLSSSVVSSHGLQP